MVQTLRPKCHRATFTRDLFTVSAEAGVSPCAVDPPGTGAAGGWGGGTASTADRESQALCRVSQACGSLDAAWPTRKVQLWLCVHLQDDISVLPTDVQISTTCLKGNLVMSVQIFDTFLRPQKHKADFADMCTEACLRRAYFLQK